MPNGFADIFVELDSLANDIKSVLPNSLKTYYWANTPPIPLPNGKYFYHARVEDAGIAAVHHEPTFARQIVGLSWDELWTRPYAYRDHVFRTMVRNQKGEVKNVAIAEVAPDDEYVDGTTNAPGVFLGDAVPSWPLPSENTSHKESQQKEALLERLLELRRIVIESNDLSDDHRQKLLAYINASELLLLIKNPDGSAIEGLLRRAAGYARSLGIEYLEGKIQEALDWILSNLHDWFS